MKRLVRSLAGGCLLLGLGGAVASASSTTSPTISGLSGNIVQIGQDFVVNGNGFSSSVPGTTGDCSVAGLPTVHFHVLGSANPPVDVQPAGKDGAHCSDTKVHVSIPPQLSAARVSISDPEGHESNNDALVVTVQPSGSVNPSTGQVGATTAIQGGGLHPLSLAASPGLAVTLGGAPRDTRNFPWTDNSIGFNPANGTGPVQATFSVITDLNQQNNAATWTTVTVNAGTYTFMPPSLDALTLTHQVVGSRLNLTGQNLGSARGSVTFAGGARGQGVAWSPSGIEVTVPPGAQPGSIGVNVPGFGPVSGPTIALDPKLGSISPNSGSANQQVHVGGFNFGAGTGTVSVGSSSEPIAGWADQGVTFTISPDTDGGDTVLSRADGAQLDLGNISIVPHLDRAESDNLAAGAQVVIDGVSLGANQGTAKLGTFDATPLLWSRSSVLLQLPPTISAGTYPLVVTSATGAASNPLNLTVIAAPSPKPTTGGNRSGQPTGVGGAVAPSFDNNHDFVKPIKPPSAVYFNVSADPHKVKAGGSATVTVTLKLNDKPVKGAAVKMAMLFTPGDDYKFTPASGVTDENGVFTSTVTTSKNPGDSVLAATSGAFSDQDHVLGTAPNGKVVSASQAAPPPTGGGFAPLLVLGLLAVGLVAAGFYLNVRSMAG